MARKQASFQSYVDISASDSDDHEGKRCSSVISSISENEENEGDTFVKLSAPTHLGRDGQPLPHTVVDTQPDTFQSNESADQVNNNKASGPSATSVKLCGFLYKRRLGTALNQFKKRWFVCSDNTCKLLYYRNPDDITPLGQIDLAHASFSFDVDHDKKNENIFKICSQRHTYLLKAPDRQTMMYWLQQLQKKRNKYYESKPSAVQESLSSKSVQQPIKGLVKGAAGGTDSHYPRTDLEKRLSLLESVEAPDTVGVGAVQNTSNKWQSLNDFSFVNLKTEMKNIAWRKKHRNMFSSDSSLEQMDINDIDQSAHAPSPVSLRRSPSLKNQASQSLSNIRQRFSKSTIGFGTLKDQFTMPPTVRCSQCKQLQESLRRESEHSEALEEQLIATREVVKTLQNHILGFMNNLNPDLINSHSDSSSSLDNSQQEISQTKEEKQFAQSQIECLQCEVTDLNDQVMMYKESIVAKDTAIISLTNRVAELEGLLGGSVSCIGGSTGGTGNDVIGALTGSDIQSIKDMCEAFQTQNRFLSQEILELTRLREQDEHREQSRKMNYAKLEAEYYCIKSKYLVCLKELHRPKLEGNFETNVVVSQADITQLLEEAMDSEAKPAPDRPKIQEHEKYDKYGFWFISPEAVDDVETRADSFQRKSDELNARAIAIDKEISINVKWENFLLSLGDRPMERTHELKLLVRAGIPTEHREKIWNFCIECHIGADRAIYGPDHYTKLLEKAAGSNSLNPAVTQVELDLLRTLPNNRHYDSSSSEGIPKLRNVLLAFSIHNEDIGYCQGLNRLAAIALLFLEEEDAFWCLVTIVEYLMPKDYYTKSLVAAHIDQRVLKDLLMDKEPRVMGLLQQQSIDLALFTFNWFMTLFVDNIPVETYLRIWDAFLFEGSKVLFRYAVAFFKYCEEDLMKIRDNLSLHRYLRTLAERITDVNKVTEIAFTSINPFPMRYITSRRQFHMQKVQEELEELHKMRVCVQQESTNNKSPSTCSTTKPPVQRMAQYHSLNSDDDLDE